MTTEKEMPRYRCHKVVGALKIGRLIMDGAGEPDRETDGSAMIFPAELGHHKIKVDRFYIRKHEPQVGGYYVVYEDGYKSFSPAKAFEDGYTLILG